MNSITTEEVERLMRVVSEPLRKHWEAKNNDGKSLVELQEALTQATADADRYSQKENNLEAWFALAVVAGIVGYGLVSGQNSGAKILWVVFFLVVLALILLRQRYCEKKLGLVSLEARQGCTVFERLQKSVHALNPFGLGNTYHDIITADYVHDKLRSLAYRVIDAQVSFDATRKDEHASRYQIIHLGNFVEKAEDAFDKSLDVAVGDFGLPFEKADIYEKAQAQYDQDQKRRAAVAAR